MAANGVPQAIDMDRLQTGVTMTVTEIQKLPAILAHANTDARFDAIGMQLQHLTASIQANHATSQANHATSQANHAAVLGQLADFRLEMRVK